MMNKSFQGLLKYSAGLPDSAVLSRKHSFLTKEVCKVFVKLAGYYEVLGKKKGVSNRKIAVAATSAMSLKLQQYVDVIDKDLRELIQGSIKEMFNEFVAVPLPKGYHLEGKYCLWVRDGKQLPPEEKRASVSKPKALPSEGALGLETEAVVDTLIFTKLQKLDWRNSNI